ncbi:MAG: molybdopterin-guanine dinucleotide biosynthesis protein B [Sedimentisphaerales bacterium]|nr:molybdopterin-guanine dinucleotide biosynthesis protein B [Sedimentisphaerales bacterium]
MEKKVPLVLGICGFKKSGKTTLIESLLKELIGQGLKVAVIKHQSEPVECDRPGSDTARFYQAGATVLGFDGQSVFTRQHASDNFTLNDALDHLGNDYDLILAEGFKTSDIDKIWLLREAESQPDPGVSGIIQSLTWHDNRKKKTLKLIKQRLKEI